MGAQQPFLYQSEKYGDMYDGFPATPFDPKAVTRASFQAKRPRPKPDGPLVSINRHPDAHEAPKQRPIYWKPMSGTTKWWIKAMRVIQLFLRVLELIAAIGVFVMFILMTNTGDLVAWVMRITTVVVMLHCVYAIFHLARAAGARTPGSSGAYHTFTAITDLVVLPLYAYGALSVRNNGAQWTTRLADQSPLEYFLPATYYTLIGSGGAHLLSLTISLWLALMFRRIHKMPPDMNPLESHLTARASHKRNKSSVATTSTYADSIEKRYSTPVEEHRRSGQPYEDMTRPPTVPFMHTRQGSQTSLHSSIRTRDSRTDLPSRQYQITPSNTSPRHSGASELSFNSKRMSGGPASPTKLTSSRNSYAQVPMNDNTSNRSSPRPTTGTSNRPSTNSTYRTSYTSQTSIPTPPRHSTPTGPPREPRFTEAWYASESLVSRTQAHLNRTDALAQLTGKPSPTTTTTSPTKAYAPLDQRYDNDLSDSDSEADLSHPIHPLRSNPTSPSSSPRPKSSFHNNGSAANLHRNSPLAEIALNDPRVSSNGGRDIADEMLSPGKTTVGDRKSSIQPETGFYSKPYGSLKPATPPVMVGGGGRQVSSGNDYGVEGKGGGGAFGGRFSVFGRRNVSGKVVEEGRGRWVKE
ncbi:hypothetical protein CONLIGDRAFT_378370 [Coniochaeta ligniaria NRRL 30616]|uniref:Uncharacterized protein n=1 Tax=Coniochaeta ligniaria NRRL 30616 TaxID=1408157 RepID=A0A1J7JGS9_9PEZI|nr:hypothetical protein CONLIGDRAFT_378370 [Coniochaeta ligniaria NRRL 30616]